MHEVNPSETTRAMAFELWMKAPMPMVTIFKRIDVTPLVRASHRTGLKFNMLMCWCIGHAASEVKEFYMLPVADKLMQFDNLAISTIISNRHGDINSVDIPFSMDLQAFSDDYARITRHACDHCINIDLQDSMIIGTSALTQCEIDGAVGMYSGIYNNPFMIWGKYKKGLLKTHLTVSFQFHHVQMDGAHAAKFLSLLQKEISGISRHVK